MEKIGVQLNSGKKAQYSIFIGKDLFSFIAKKMQGMGLAARYAVIADSNTGKIYGKKLVEQMQELGLKSELIEFKAGEKSKCRAVKAKIEDQMFEKGFGRDSAIIAVGGGVCGDLAGFVAATYMRGVPIIQVATTTVAQTDSSVGGKTAIDTVFGKNLVGAFHQPSAVFIDVETLKTLPEKEFKAGLVEAVKHGIIADAKLFRFLEEKLDFLLDRKAKGWSDAMVDLLAVNCAIKARIIEQDEREQGLRKILTYGHTIGHTIEALKKFGLGHGPCVAIGMSVEAEIAVEKGFPRGDAKRQRALLQKLGIPTTVPKGILAKEVINALKLDKKARSGKPEFVLPSRIGDMMNAGGKYGIVVSKETILSAMQKVGSD